MALNRETLLTLFSDLSQVAQWIWNGDGQPFVAPTSDYPLAVGCMGYVNLTTSSAIGVDDIRPTHNLDSNKLDNGQYGVREITLSIRIESFASNVAAFDLCEQVRTRLRRATSRARLSDLNLSIKMIGPVVDVDYTQDNRTIFANQFDLVCNRYVDGNEGAPEQGLEPAERDQWIETVNTDGIVPYEPEDP